MFARYNFNDYLKTIGYNEMDEGDKLDFIDSLILNSTKLKYELTNKTNIDYNDTYEYIYQCGYDSIFRVKIATPEPRFDLKGFIISKDIEDQSERELADKILASGYPKYEIFFGGFSEDRSFVIPTTCRKNLTECYKSYGTIVLFEPPSAVYTRMRAFNGNTSIKLLFDIKSVSKVTNEATSVNELYTLEVF